MSRKERNQMTVMAGVQRQELTQEQTAELLGGIDRPSGSGGGIRTKGLPGWGIGGGAGQACGTSRRRQVPRQWRERKEVVRPLRAGRAGVGGGIPVGLRSAPAAFPPQPKLGKQPTNSNQRGHSLLSSKGDISKKF